jgi:hypothetical protein
MRNLLLPIILLAVTITPALAARRIQIVSPNRAAQSQGGLVAVRGRASIHPDIAYQGTDIDIIGDNGRVVFVGFIPKLNEYAFPQVSGLDGKSVILYGIIEMYRGVPATQLIYQDQLRAG